MVLIDEFLEDAIELDVDALCDGTDVVVAGIMQHFEEAGIHSGDSAFSLPPHNLPDPVLDRHHGGGGQQDQQQADAGEPQVMRKTDQLG